MAASADETGKGTLSLRYEPKACFTTPCPQFSVLKMNGKEVKDLGADILNFDISQSSARAFKTISVKGTWVKKDNYLEITASSWHSVVGEKLAPPVTAPQAK